MMELGPSSLIVIMAVVVFTMIFRDILQSIRYIRKLNLRIRRIGRRKQDWTPREDPALWRKR